MPPGPCACPDAFTGGMAPFPIGGETGTGFRSDTLVPMTTWLSTQFVRAARPFRRFLIRLLELDRPVPERSDDEIAAEVERDYRWNFAVNFLDMAFFWPALAFISTTTILPLFVSKLTPSPLAIGFLAMLAQGSWFLPQLFTTNAVERLPRRKPVPVKLGLFLERLPLWFLVPSALVAGSSPQLALAILLVAYTWHSLGAGVVAAAWQDMIARCFPVDRRGRFFGIASFTGAAAGAIGAVASVWLLEAYPFPLNFAYCFAVAAVLITVSWAFLALAREPAQAPKATRTSTRQYLAGLPDLVRRDHNFRRFWVARLLLALGGMASGFVTVAAVKRWAMPDSAAGLFTAAFLVGEMVGNLAFGLLADRRGHKLSLELGAVAACLGFGLAWLAPSPQWYYVVFALMGIVSAAVIVSGILVVMEFSGPERRPTYVGIANTGVGVVSMLAPLLGAALALLGYNWLFAVAAAVNLAAAALFHWWVREPRWHRPVG